MAKIVGDICAHGGTYVKDGEEKARWLKCGVLMETDKGLRIKLDVIPLGGEGNGLWLSVFDKKESHGGGSGGQRPQRGSQGVSGKPDDKDDIPF